MDAGMMHAGEDAHSEEAMAQGVAPEKAEGDEDYTNLQRVKVYRLNEGGHWDDKGTGHVSCEYMEVRVCKSDYRTIPRRVRAAFRASPRGISLAFASFSSFRVGFD